MKKLVIVAPTIAIPSFSFFACKDQRGNGATMSNSTAQISNADLANSIKIRLDSDDQLQTANLQASADAQKHIATLTGTVGSESLRGRAIDLAKSAQPGLTVEDQIEIAPTKVSPKDHTEQMARDEWAKAKQLGEKVGRQLDDAWIYGKSSPS